MNEQFKEGQWVRNIENDDVVQVQFYAEESNYPNGCYFVTNYETVIFKASNCVLWKPKDK